MQRKNKTYTASSILTILTMMIAAILIFSFLPILIEAIEITKIDPDKIPIRSLGLTKQGAVPEGENYKKAWPTVEVKATKKSGGRVKIWCEFTYYPAKPGPLAYHYRSELYYVKETGIFGEPVDKDDLGPLSGGFIDMKEGATVTVGPFPKLTKVYVYCKTHLNKVWEDDIDLGRTEVVGFSIPPEERVEIMAPEEEKAKLKKKLKHILNRINEEIKAWEESEDAQKRAWIDKLKKAKKLLFEYATDQGIKKRDLVSGEAVKITGYTITGHAPEDELTKILDILEESKKAREALTKKPAVRRPLKGTCGQGTAPQGISANQWRQYTCQTIPKDKMMAKLIDKKWCVKQYCPGAENYLCCLQPSAEPEEMNCVINKSKKEFSAGKEVKITIEARGITKLNYVLKNKETKKGNLTVEGSRAIFNDMLNPGNYSLKVGYYPAGYSLESSVTFHGQCTNSPFEFTVTGEKAKEDKGIDWWKIPCLKFWEAPGKKIKGWGPFSSPWDAAMTVMSALLAGKFLGLEPEWRCIPEEPDTDRCEECETDPYRICTKERCEILGHNCFAVKRDDRKGYHCFLADCEDMELAKLSRLEFKWYLGLTADPAGTASISGNQLDVSSVSELPWNVTYALIKIEQDKEAKCRYALNVFEANWSEMENFEGNEEYPLMQNVSIPLSNVSSGDHWIFIKCRNKCGAVNLAEDDSNWIKFKIAEIPEAIPPIIEYLEPESGYISSAAKFANITLWLNENGKAGRGDDATCKYSTIANNLTTNWSEMISFEGPHGNGNNSVIFGECKNNQKCRYIEQNTCAHCQLKLDLEKGYSSLDPKDIIAKIKEAGLEIDITEEELSSLISSEKAKIYPFIFRCQDMQNNKNEGDSYALIAIDPFNVSIIKPPVEDPYERMPAIEIETYSGNVSRATNCKYKVFEGRQISPRAAWDEMIWIDEALSESHEGKVNESLKPKNYTMYVKCQDEARIQVANWTYFEIKEDKFAPKVIRLYHYTKTGDYLLVETDEEAECVYGTDAGIGCSYNFTNGNTMASIDKFMHTAYWQIDHNYYVKCKDKWDNYPGAAPDAKACTVIVSPYEIPEL